MAGQYTLAVNVVAGTKKFSAGMKSATKDVQVFGQRVAAQTKRVATFALKLGTVLAGAAVAAGAAILALARDAAKSIDQVAKLSTRLGITTEALTAYTFAANQAGVETRTFTMGLQRMIRRIAEAAAGTGEAKATLEQLAEGQGLDLSKLFGAAPEQQLAMVADALEGISDPAERLRIAFKLFDSEGTAMLQLLNQGTPAMKAMAKEAEALGLVVSKVDAKAIEDATDAMGALGAVWQGVKNALAIELAPVITAAATWFTNLAKNGFDAGAMVRKGMDIMAAGLGAVLDLFQDLWPAMRLLLKFTGLQTQVMMGLAQGIGYVVDAVARLFGYTTKIGSSIGTLRKLHGDAMTSGVEFYDSLAGGPAASDQINNFLDGLRNSVAGGVETGITRPDAIATVAQEAAAVAEPVIEQAKPPITASTATAAAVEKGTAAALSAIFRARRGSEEGKLDRERNALAEEHISVSEDIRAVLVNQPPLLIAGVGGISPG
jgi:hypothetical protein